MFLQTHRYIRGVILGLMFFLAGTAFCSSDSYDPNPYDDIPPVVTVEYNYVVPGTISIRLPGAQQSEGMHFASRNVQSQFAQPVLLGLNGQKISVSSHLNLAQIVIPLRR